MVGGKDLATFLYGFDVTAFNQYINFKKSSGGPVLTATLNIGNYTATQFMAEVKRAMEFIDGVNTYTVSLNRSLSGGRANAMRVVTSGSYLAILFGSGVNAESSPRDLMGADHIDYIATTITFPNTAGILLIPDMHTYNFQPVDSIVENDGVRNISATGIKETLVFAQMLFFSGEWKWITDLDNSDQYTQWIEFMKYATQQLQLEFTPSINEDPTVFYQCTLESTPEDSNGMKYTLKTMTGQNLFRFYETGSLKFRIVVT